MALTNFQLRIVSAVVGLPIVALLIVIGGWPFAIVAGAVALLASAEFSHGFLMPSLPLSAVWGAGPGFLVAGIMVAGAYASPAFVAVGVAIAIALLIAGFSRTNMFGPRKPLRVYAGAIIYIGLLLSTLVLLRAGDDGRDWVLLALASTFAVDTGAYAVGKLIGRHKMAPAISPGKTWEGAAGGYISGGIALVVLHQLLDLPGDAIVVGTLAALVPVAAMLGDLLASWIKRRMGIKDASSFIPGHGGFMDRLDSILFVVPVIYLISTFLIPS